MLSSRMSSWISMTERKSREAWHKRKIRPRKRGEKIIA